MDKVGLISDGVIKFLAGYMVGVFACGMGALLAYVIVPGAPLWVVTVGAFGGDLFIMFLLWLMTE